MYKFFKVEAHFPLSISPSDQTLSQGFFGRGIEIPMQLDRPLHPTERVLMGPGPSTVPVRVLQALAAPTLGHLDPEYLTIMDETRQMLRQVFQTNNEMTMAISGTGSAGMEAAVCNLVEPGDEMIVCVNGVFGGRMKDVAQRYGAVVHAVEAPWGRGIELEQIEKELQAHPKTKIVGIVHAETSTGEHQPLEAIAKLVRSSGRLLIVDAVTSLGGVDIPIDKLGIDVCYSGTQKVLELPAWSGTNYLFFSGCRCHRTPQEQSDQLVPDVSMLRSYWSNETRLPPHSSHQHDLCASRSSADCARRRFDCPHCSTLAQPSHAAGRPGGHGPRIHSSTFFDYTSTPSRFPLARMT